MAKLIEILTRPVPFPTGWAVRCPCCERQMEYEVEEDVSGSFGFDCTEIPICETCNVMFIPETVQATVITTVNPLLADEQNIPGIQSMETYDEKQTDRPE